MGFSMKSKKEDILEALNKAHEQLESAGLMEKGPAESAKCEESNAAVETANKAIEEKLLSPELLAKYEAVLTATALKEKELADLYDVEEKMQNLMVVSKACSSVIAKWKEEEASAKQEHDIKIQRYRKEYEEKIRSIDNEEAEYRKDAGYKRKKEEEEYQYGLMRKHKSDEDSWADKQKLLDAEQEEKIAGLQKREDAITLREEEIKELELKVKSIPELLEAEKRTAFEAGKAEAGKSYGFEKRALETNYTHQLEMSAAREETLQASNTELKATNAVLSDKLDKAYSEMRELASKVAENGGVKVVNSNDTNKK